MRQHTDWYSAAAHITNPIPTGSMPTPAQFMPTHRQMQMDTAWSTMQDPEWYKGQLKWCHQQKTKVILRDCMHSMQSSRIQASRIHRIELIDNSSDKTKLSMPFMFDTTTTTPDHTIVAQKFSPSRVIREDDWLLRVSDRRVEVLYTVWAVQYIFADVGHSS